MFFLRAMRDLKLATLSPNFFNNCSLSPTHAIYKNTKCVVQFFFPFASNTLFRKHISAIFPANDSQIEIHLKFREKIMRKVFKLPLLAIVFLMLGSTVSAQKIGYLNTTSILAEMSDVKAMRSDLEALKTQLQKQGMAKVEAYNSREAELMKALEAGELSDKQKQAGMDELDVKRKEILALEKEMANKLADKEAELLKPILDRVNKAIAAVAKENGFLFILSEQALLWAAESQDITNLVKAKLSM